jgi:hypothetical protein
MLNNHPFGINVNAAAPLANPSGRVAMTFPVRAPEGTRKVSTVSAQVSTVADIPLTVTVPVDAPNAVPVNVSIAPIRALFGVRLVIAG